MRSPRTESVTPMALIEGVGDEVTVLCALLLLLSVVVLAWISTHTSDRGAAQWSSQARSGSGQDVRPSGSDHLPGNDSPPTTAGEGSDPVTPDTSSVLGEARNDLPTGDPSPTSQTVRHRGPHTQDDPAGAPDTLTLRLKFLNETERVVTVRPTDSVLHIKRSQFPGQEPRVRLIYQGQLLRDDAQTVASLQLADGCVLHCHLSQHAAASGSGGPDPSRDSVNIGSLMVPVFLLLLGALWYCHFQYPQLFNATATACLGAMTLFLLVLVFSSYRR